MEQSSNIDLDKDETKQDSDSKSDQLLPGWKYEWVDYSKYEQLKTWTSSLPSSIQRVIEWNHALYSNHEVSDIDFDEFDKDLKYQYKKCNGNKTELKKLYFNYFPDHVQDYVYYHRESKQYDRRFDMVFGDRSGTFLHFLFGHLYGTKPKYYDKLSMTDKNKVIRQVLGMMKLLCLNRIIDVYGDALWAHTMGIYIWEGIKELTYIFNDENTSHHIIDDIVDLIMICINLKKYDEQEAIMRVYDSKYKYDDNDPEERWWKDKISMMNLLSTECGFGRDHMSNNNNILQRLLFRGMLPFSFIKQDVKYNYDTESKQRERKEDVTVYQPSTVRQDDSLQKCIQSLLQRTNIMKNTLKDKGKDPDSQIAVLSPLILMQFSCKARGKMNELLSHCIVNNDYIENKNLSKLITSIISGHLFVDYKLFYDKDMENNSNVQSILLLSYLKNLEMDKQFIQLFKEKYCNKNLLNYMMKNYAASFVKAVGTTKIMDFGFIRSLIETYNDNEDGNKFPLKPNGFYMMLDKMMRYEDIGINYKCLMKLLKYGKEIYKDEFDINFQRENNWSIIESLLRWQRNTSSEDTSFTSDKLIETVDFILTEFDGKYDLTNPDLLYHSMKNGYLEFIKYYVIKYDISLNKLCETMNKMINDIFISLNDWEYGHSWNRYESSQEENKVFLDSIKEFCLSTKCKNDKDIQLLNETITNTQNTYTKIVDARKKEMSP